MASLSAPTPAAAASLTDKDKSDQRTRKRGRLNKQELLEQAEAQDLADLRDICAQATAVDTWDKQGRPVLDCLVALQGLWRVRLPTDVFQDLCTIHRHILKQIGTDRLVPWAGVGADWQRVRGFGFVGAAARQRLVDSDVTLHAMEKTAQPREARRDEQANWRASCILRGHVLDTAQSAARALIQVLKQNDDDTSDLPSDLSLEQLVTFQPNLHQGAPHLAAHLDWPLHEGFGKVIVTVAIEQSATILLLDGAADQAAYKFDVHPGECYVLSGRVRNEFLHAVLAHADGDDKDKDVSSRESLNLRFGIHTAEQAYQEITRHWPEEEDN